MSSPSSGWNSVKVVGSYFSVVGFTRGNTFAAVVMEFTSDID